MKAMRRIGVVAAAVGIVGLFTAGGCPENAGWNKLTGAEPSSMVDIANSGTITMINNHVEGQNNEQDQSENTAPAAKGAR